MAKEDSGIDLPKIFGFDLMSLFDVNKPIGPLGPIAGVSDTCRQCISKHGDGRVNIRWNLLGREKCPEIVELFREQEVKIIADGARKYKIIVEFKRGSIIEKDEYTLKDSSEIISVNRPGIYTITDAANSKKQVTIYYIKIDDDTSDIINGM